MTDTLSQPSVDQPDLHVMVSYMTNNISGRFCYAYLSPDRHHAQTALERSSGRNSLPLYGSVRLMGTCKAVTFDAASLNIWIDRMGVPTLSGSSVLLELNRYEFRP